jgi:serine/threonine protein kinase
MKTPEICLGCMEEKGPESICQRCGYEANTVTESLLHLPPGTLLQDKYLIGRVLGQGGFGITYLALDTTLRLKLAIKEYLPQELATRSGDRRMVTAYKADLNEQFEYGLVRFLEEARILARFVEHPNVISVRDYFEANGTAYLVMSYLEGLTLENYLDYQGGKISIEQTLAIFMPVLDALKEVHSVGILHRDISPDNLLIDNRGRVIVIDFGAARQEVRGKSKMMSVILKAGYAPEEQHRSRGVQGPWTDIYAVSATIYRAITGEKPTEAIDRLAEDVLAAPSSLGVEISNEVEKVLLKGLAVRPKDRYQNIAEFQQAFIDAQADSPTVTNEKHKRCPHCGEEIYRRAVKCKYCYSLIDAEHSSRQTREMKNYDNRNLEYMPENGLSAPDSKGSDKADIPDGNEIILNTCIENFSAQNKLPNTRNNRPDVDTKRDIASTKLQAVSANSTWQSGNLWHDLLKEPVAGLVALFLCLLLTSFYLFVSLGGLAETYDQLAIAIGLIAMLLSIVGLVQSKNNKTIPIASLIFAIVLLVVIFINLSHVPEITNTDTTISIAESQTDNQFVVPGDYATIQEAIDNAPNDAVIIVAEGIYAENIDFKGKEITLRSTDPGNPNLVAKTIIDGSNNGPVVTFNSGESRNTVLSGFTITGGSGVRKQYTITSYDGNRLSFDRFYAGGIFIAGRSSPTITNNVITSNQIRNVSLKVLAVGGGIAILDNSNPLIENNVITDNYSEAYGGGIAIWYHCNPVIKDNIINGNRAGDIGGGIMIAMMCNPEIFSNTIQGNNSANWSGGIYVAHMSEAKITDNTIADNTAVNGAGLFIRRTEAVSVRDNEIKDNKASGNGGAVYMDNQAEAIINSNMISGNTAKSGGGIWVDSDSTLRLASPDDNSYENNKPNNVYRR